MIVKLSGDTAELGDAVAMVVSGKIVLVDKEDYPRLAGYAWCLRKTRSQYYAVRKVRTKNSEFLVFMHRQITHCPNDMVVHHVNRNGLDNRKENLEVMPEKEHHLIHGFC